MRTVPTALGVDEAVERIETAVRAAGMKVFARIDQAAEARAAGLVVPACGRPDLRKPPRRHAADGRTTHHGDRPPLKALVWQDERGAVWITFNTPALLVERHGLDPALAARLAPVGDLLEKAVRG